MEPEPHKKPIRFFEIDLLRFLAALAVVFFHYTYRGYMADNYSPLAFPELGYITKYGFLGVHLFFIISGYVVLLSAQGKTVRQFFLSRITRLYPAFWICCTLTFLVKLGWGPGHTDTHMSERLHATLGQYVFNMTMLHEFLGIGPMDAAYWSLTVEITFYFLVALLIGFHLLKHVNLLLTGWLAYAAIPHLNHEQVRFAYLFFPNYAPLFVAGMLFYLLQQPNGRTWQRYALLLCSFALAAQAAIRQVPVMELHYHDTFSKVVVVGAIVSFFLLFYLISFRIINLSRFSWLTWWGSLTYPLYLLHSDIGFIAFYRLQYVTNKYVLVGGVFVLMLVAARVIHVWVEKPLSRLLGAKITQWFQYLDQPHNTTPAKILH